MSEEQDIPKTKAKNRGALGNFGAYVCKCRRARGLTQAELAERAGLSVDTIGRLEQGAFSPTLDTLRKLCGGLDMLLSTLFEGLEFGQRDASSELAEALDFLTPEEKRALHQLFASIRARVEREDE